MTTDTLELNGEEILIEVIEKEAGALLDSDGFQQPTYSGVAVLGWEMDWDTGARTGRRVVKLGNGAQSETWVTEAMTLAEAVAECDRDWIAGLWLPGEMSVGAQPEDEAA